MKSNIPKFLFIIIAAGALVWLAVSLPKKITQISPTKVQTKLGFGKLPVPTTSDASRAVISGAEMMGASQAMPMAPSTMPVPSSSPDIISICESGGDCPVENLPPKVIYSSEIKSMPEVPSELTVYRVQALAFAKNIVGEILNQIGAPKLFKGDAELASFSVHDEDFQWTFDAASGQMSFWSAGPVYIMGEAVSGGAGASTGTVSSSGGVATPNTVNLLRPIPIPPEPGRTSEILNAEAIRIANKFLTDHGIDLSKYGSPQVESFGDVFPPCKFSPCPMEATRELSIAEGVDSPMVANSGYPIWQSSVSVWYGGKIDDTELVDWQGGAMRAITVSIDSSSKKVSNGSIWILPPVESSNYPTISKEDALASALLGGLNPYYSTPDIFPPDIEAKRPVVRIKLTESKLGLFQKISYDGNASTTYYLPVVAFTGTITDQFGNTYPWGTLVNALKSESFE